MIQLLIWFSLLSSIAEARVFNMKDNQFGGYFQGYYGQSRVGRDFFVGESSATSFSKGFRNHTGGEFGFLYKTDKLSWLFGLELIRPDKTRGVASTSGTSNYNYTSDLSAYVPKVGLELIFFESNDFRFFVNGAVGTASLSMKTDYSNLTIAPNSNFSIEGKGSAQSLNYGMGAEWHWNDNTTFVIGASFRQLEFDKIKYLKDVASSFTGAHTKGQRILKSDGSALSYNFSNYFFSMGFRFWIH